MTRILALFAAVLSLSSCAEDPMGCDPCSTSAVVFGVVTDSLGATVADFPLELRVLQGSCADGSLRAGAMTRTNSVGRYRERLVSLYSPFTADCVEIIANYNSDPRWPLVRSEHTVALEFRADWPAGEPHDSLRIDVSVTPSMSARQ
jgi:hypothetical protein